MSANDDSHIRPHIAFLKLHFGLDAILVARWNVRSRRKRLIEPGVRSSLVDQDAVLPATRRRQVFSPPVVDEAVPANVHNPSIIRPACRVVIEFVVKANRFDVAPPFTINPNPVEVNVRS